MLDRHDDVFDYSIDFCVLQLISFVSIYSKQTMGGAAGKYEMKDVKDYKPEDLAKVMKLQHEGIQDLRQTVRDHALRLHSTMENMAAMHKEMSSLRDAIGISLDIYESLSLMVEGDGVVRVPRGELVFMPVMKKIVSVETQTEHVEPEIGLEKDVEVPNEEETFTEDQEGAEEVKNVNETVTEDTEF